MKIAVCLSGQSRTWKTAKDNILKYFDVGADVDFFIHTWDINTIRLSNQSTVIPFNPNLTDTDVLELRESYNPKAIEVEKYNPDQFYDNPWISLYYSFMKSIQLMRMHELENDITYDIVIKSRLDVNFPQDGVNKFGHPSNKFYIHPIRPLVLYTSSEQLFRFECELNQTCADDVFFYGDSQTMFLLSNIYKWFFTGVTKTKEERDNKLFATVAYHLYGPGTILYKYAVKMGIYPFGLLHTPYYIVRFEAEEQKLHSITDWRRIWDIANRWNTAAEPIYTEKTNTEVIELRHGKKLI